MNDFIAAVIGSSVISSIINSISSNKNNYNKSKIEKRLDIQTKKINRLKENYSKFNLCMTDVLMIVNMENLQDNETFIKNVKKMTSLLTLICFDLEIGEKKVPEMDISDFIYTMEYNIEEKKDSRFNKENSLLIKIITTNSINMKYRNSAMISFINGTKRALLDIKNIENHKLGLIEISNYCSSMMSQLVSDKENKIYAKENRLYTKIINFINDSKKTIIFFSLLYIIMIILFSLYVSYILWNSKQINNSLINKGYSIIILLVILNFICLIYVWWRSHIQNKKKSTK
ncbi:hypothetical protein DY120_07515 [Apilactobacillus micheneri]|uniref:Uncharacterized protein n=1 Tax=Apilactobacillus micheneri TaxID=1899430 RepID=A0ABY2YUW1_9LACO|nr:hypothetical protein [Apilactobacillus micheneri]TPR22834.1 hypothetical protein DY114_07500 [Apilactobacillus micheneri]TPR24406.1 hypothetical protein DY111_07515 [Apilactobacillus micheneri]TPR27284.1 hypothetical protein DY113_07295 [Apilactobacillus micheneri]TPR28666.1 hypothetical protein DY127_07275 [Apilactobacillus micheneri]TPR28726.1 hypothetical protein DY117_07275 [Apilactobacillus micheneri]